MARKILSVLALALLISGNAMAQSRPSGNWWTQFIQWWQNSSGQHAPSSGGVQSVPELDGSVAVLAIGLTLAVVFLIREKRRSR
jgi:hypothetical protein